jgi:hypothetical protein
LHVRDTKIESFPLLRHYKYRFHFYSRCLLKLSVSSLLIAHTNNNVKSDPKNIYICIESNITRSIKTCLNVSTPSYPHQSLLRSAWRKFSSITIWRMLKTISKCAVWNKKKRELIAQICAYFRVAMMFRTHFKLK